VDERTEYVVMRIFFTIEEFDRLLFREDCEYYVPENYYRVKNCTYVVAQFRSYHPMEWWIFEVVVR
jgi:hypothetical protein